MDKIRGFFWNLNHHLQVIKASPKLLKSNLKVQKDYFKAMRRVQQRYVQPAINPMFDHGEGEKERLCLTFTEI